MGYFHEAVLRVVAMQREAIQTPAGRPPEAFPYLVAHQPYPYWCNWPGPVRRESASADREWREHTLNMRLVVAADGADVPGEAEKRLNDYIAAVYDYFAARRLLKRTPADPPVTYLDPDEGAVLGVATGLRVLQLSETVRVKAVDFPLLMRFSVPIARQVI